MIGVGPFPRPTTRSTACLLAFVLATFGAACAGLSGGGDLLPHITVTRPVVIVPGILGSRLEDERNGRVVWGKLFQLRALTVHETLIEPGFDGKDGLELPIASPDLRANRDHLVATGILDRFAIIPHVAEVQAYQRLLEALEVCGYRPGEVASCGLAANATVFPYDWRRDLVENAQRLAEAVRGIQERAGDPETRIDLIAHSMGGLVVEYYLLYGDEDVLDQEPLPPPSYAGGANVRHVILLGVPHLGSVEALGILDRGRRVGWRKISNEATFTMPSLYHLLPASATVHVHDSAGAAAFDLDDADGWQSFGLSVFSASSRKAFLRRCKVLFPSDWQRQSDELYTMFPAHLERVLDRSARLRRALAVFPTRPPDGVEVHLIGSATRSTPASAELRRDGAGWRLAVASGPGGGEAPGDGTVTAESFTWGAYDGAAPVSGDGGLPFEVEWVDAAHSKLPRNPEALRRIAEILAREVEIAIPGQTRRAGRGPRSSSR